MKASGANALDVNGLNRLILDGRKQVKSPEYPTTLPGSQTKER
jgi:hypothetical protein